jgi:hypothetical protein
MVSLSASNLQTVVSKSRGSLDFFFDRIVPSRLRLFQKLVASFKAAFDLASDPPPCFYLEGSPLLDEPFYISLQEIGNVCLLNGVKFQDDENLGRQISIEDREGLNAAVMTHISWSGYLANLDSITRWRPYWIRGRV